MNAKRLERVLLEANEFGLNNSDLKYSGKDWLKKTLNKYGGVL